MDDRFVNLGEEVILTLLWQSGRSESAKVCFVISLSSLLLTVQMQRSARRVFVCVCVCGERERERERRERESHITASCGVVCLRVCVCVCVWERERERERESHHSVVVWCVCVCVVCRAPLACVREGTRSHNAACVPYELHHCLSRDSVPSRAWTDAKN